MKVGLSKMVWMMVILVVLALLAGTYFGYQAIFNSPAHKVENACDRAKADPDSAARGISVDEAICMGQIKP